MSIYSVSKHLAKKLPNMPFKITQLYTNSWQKTADINVELKDAEGDGSVYNLTVYGHQVELIDNDENIASFIVTLLFNQYPHLALKSTSKNIKKPYPDMGKSWMASQTSKHWVTQAVDDMKKQATDPVVGNKTVSVSVGSDLTKFHGDMEKVFLHLTKVAGTLGDSFNKIAEAMKPFMDQLAEIATIEDAHSQPGITISNMHPGMKKRVDCPSKWCQIQNSTLSNMIQHLNDTHEWTREAIADWLDTLDEQPVFYPKVGSGNEAA